MPVYGLVYDCGGVEIFLLVHLRVQDVQNVNTSPSRSVKNGVFFFFLLKKTYLCNLVETIPLSSVMCGILCSASADEYELVLGRVLYGARGCCDAVF